MVNSTFKLSLGTLPGQPPDLHEATQSRKMDAILGVSNILYTSS
jgi:hypothetical protein